MVDEALIRKKFEALRGSMNERVTRLWAGAEADAIGYGGVLAVARATGLAPNTVKKGRDELRAGAKTDDLVKVRRKGGGGRRHEDVHPELLPTLKKLVDPATRGDPESPLRWTAKSAVVLSNELFHGYGIRVSDKTVGKLLRQLGYSLQAAKKTVEGAQHPDRNAQFEHINAQAKDARERNVPFISVDTKKKELVGNFKNAGVEWQPQDQPELVDVHDFPSTAVGKAIPYGIYDVGDNRGFVNVGTDHDTPVFAVTSIEAWWRRMGNQALPRRDGAVHHGRRGWQQRVSVARMEGRTAAPCRQTRPHDPREPPPAGDQQVEQDRAPPLLLHHHELARAAASHVRDDRQPDRQHDKQRRPRRKGDPRSSPLPDRQKSDSEGAAGDQHREAQLPRRLELLDSTPRDRRVNAHVAHSRALRM